jgi:hypothetical protein
MNLYITLAMSPGLAKGVIVGDLSPDSVCLASVSPLSVACRLGEEASRSCGVFAETRGAKQR